jgi:hypothetical protein
VIARNTEPKQRPIEDLSLRDFDQAYSLIRTGWSCAEIAKRYGVSETEVGRIVEEASYVELRKLCDTKQPNKSPHASSISAPSTKKPRKRRSDAKYVSARERQAAYRARLRDTQRTAIEEPSPAAVTDIEVPATEGIAVTVCRDSTLETSPKDPDSSPEIVTAVREAVTDPVTHSFDSEGNCYG